MSIELRFCKDYAGFCLDVDLKLHAHGVTAIFGPSGSGKTTLLRCIAGLEYAANGRMLLRGATWQDEKTFLSPHQRQVGYVFQDANLFSHLDVAGNLEFGARRSRKSLIKSPVLTTGTSPVRPEPVEGYKTNAIVDLLDIGPLLDRRVHGLSGGERQRVAIARALLSSPQLLLMDEPLAALERERKREILPYLDRLIDELDIPILYVSHAIDEVSRLADHIVLLDKGRAIASGPLSEITSRLDLPLAQDDDASVVIAASVGALDRNYHLMRLDFKGGSVHASLRELPIGHAARIAIHARDVSIALSATTDSSILNRLPATIVEFADARHPAHLLVRLNASGTAILARITHRSRDQLQLREGQQVWAQIKTVALVD